MASHGLEITEGDPAKLFKVNTKLGEGSYGSVYSAIDLRDGKEVAIKVLEVDQADIGELRKEVNILKTCDHPYIVGYRGCWEKNKQVWIVMEYCHGGSLGDLLLLCDTILDEQQAKAVMWMTLHGLVYLHQRKLIHRDIKAANILLTREGVCKLGDFGVSAELTSTVAKRKTAVGTPYWMAPEMLASSEYDSKADIWSLAITLIELCVGEPPHAQQHPMRVLFLIPTSPPPTIPEQHLYTAHFNDWLKRALEKDPALRPDAQALLKHPWMNGMNEKVAQTIVKRLVAEHLPDLDACREQESRENGWTADNILATTAEQMPGHNPNSTFKMEMISDNLSTYHHTQHDDTECDPNGTMVIAPSIKQHIQNEMHNNNSGGYDDDYDCGTTVLHQDVVAKVQQHARGQSISNNPTNNNNNNNNNNGKPGITVRNVAHNQQPVHVNNIFPANTNSNNNTPLNKSPVVSKHAVATMVLKDDYKDLVAKGKDPSMSNQSSNNTNGTPVLSVNVNTNNNNNNNNNKTLGSPKLGATKLPIPPPPSASSQYQARPSGASTPHHVSSNYHPGANLFKGPTNQSNTDSDRDSMTSPQPISSGAGVTALSQKYKNQGSTPAAPTQQQIGSQYKGTTPSSPRAGDSAFSFRSPQGSVAGGHPSGSGAFPEFTSTTQPLLLQANTTNVNDMVQSMRAQCCGDLAQMMKALEAKRKQDEETLKQFYALAKKQIQERR